MQKRLSVSGRARVRRPGSKKGRSSHVPEPMLAFERLETRELMSAAPTPLHGTVIGTTGSYQNLGNVAANAVDASLTSFFDAPTANGNWVGMDLGAADSISQITYAPRAGKEARMVGGAFQGSNSADFSGAWTMYSITSAPTAGVATTVLADSPGGFRYVRYLSPDGSYGNIADFEVTGTPATAAATTLSGSVIGTNGSWHELGNTKDKAFNNDLNSFFDAPGPDGGWVGLDLGSPASITTIAFAPRTGFNYRMTGGVFQASNTADFSSGVVNLFTIASAPSYNNLTTAAVNPGGNYQYIRYLGPTGSYGNIAEFQVFGTPTAAVAPPAAPTSLVATAVSSAGVQLTWSDSSNDETGFVLERSSDPGFSSIQATVPLASADVMNGSVGSYTDQTAGAGSTSYYRVRATNSGGQSTNTSASPVTLPSPGAASATAVSASEIDLSWSADPANQSGYDIQRSTDGSTWTDAGAVASNLNSYQDQGLTDGTAYQYRISEINAPGAPVLAASATTSLLQPSNFTATPVTSRQINLAWTNNSESQTGFVLHRSTDGTNWTTVNISGSATSFSDNTVADGTTYQYRIRAVNALTKSNAATSSATTTLAAPTTFAANVVSSSEIDLSWNIASQDQSGFAVQRSTNGVNFSTIGNAGAGATGFADINLNASTSYYYRVDAVNAVAASTFTSVVNATTIARGSGPAAPSYLSAQAVSDTRVNVYWIDNANDAAGYVLERSSDGNNWTTLQTLGAGATSASDTNLSPSTTYFYRLHAANAQGQSIASNVSSTTTSATFVGESNPAPQTTSGFQFSQMTNQAYVDSDYRSNIFYVGQTVALRTLINPAATYEVRNYDGDLVDSGAVAAAHYTDSSGHLVTGTIQPRVTQQGWYKIYLFGTQTTAQWGNVVGGSTFVIFNNDPNFPALPAKSMTPATFPGAPAVTRVDPAVNFNWDTTQPARGIGNNVFSVKWTGQVRADSTGTYTFYTGTDDGVRLWVNGKLLVDNWTDHADTENSGTITLQAGQRYDIEMDYYQNAGGSRARLSWSGPNQAKAIIDSGHLYASSSATSAGGLTGQYWGVLADATNDYSSVIRDITAMGVERYQITDASNPDGDMATIDAEIAIDKQLYLPFDTYRDRKIMIAFPNGTQDSAGVEKVVAHFKGVVGYYEGLNEPNFKYTGAAYAPIAQAFHDAVHAADPNAKVIGPGVVTMGIYGMQWCNDFFSHGGTKAIDAFSFHAYNNVNGDLWLARQSMQLMNQMLNTWGLGNIERWQTEQGYTSLDNGVYTPQLQGQWTMLQMMVFEQNGVPKEQNYVWYDTSHGFWDFAMWWQNEDTSLNVAAPLMRNWSEQLYGTKFTQALDFGPQLNNQYVGSLYTGPGKSVLAMMSAGSPDGHVMLQATGSSIHVTSSFGVGSDLPVINGYVNLPVGETPVYVDIAQGQTVTVVKHDFGADIAAENGVVVSTPGNASDASNNAKLIDGQLQNWFWQQDYSGIAFQLPFNNQGSATIELDLPSVQKLDRAVLFASVPWQFNGSLLDYSLQYNSNGKWITVDHVTENPRTIGVDTPTTRTTVDQFYSGRDVFESDFAPVMTDKVRLVINQVTYGGAATQLAYQGGAQGNGTPYITLRELELYGS